ncbi:hypothetical protein JCM39068_41350 [Desulfocastanea catecholica]
MFSVTCALVTAAVLCMIIPSTRNLGVIFVTVLFFLYPIPVTLILIGIGAVYYWRKFM